MQHSPSNPAPGPLTQSTHAEANIVTSPDSTLRLAGEEPVTKQHQKVVVLAGNPNVGKSIFFNAYTGKYVNVSNFPGTTVDIPKGQMADGSLLKDTPGIYGLSGMSEEETVAEESIFGADVIINVVSALSLSRDLFLTQQLIDYGRPLVIALNQMDEAKARHLSIRIETLETLLGVKVVPTVALTREGLKEVIQALPKASLGHRTPDSPEPEALRELEKNPGERMKIYGHRRYHVNAITSQVVTDESHPENFAKRFGQSLGAWLLNPLVGLLAMACVLLVLYQVVGVWVAGDLVNLIEGDILLAHVIPVIQSMVSPLFPVGTAFYNLLAGEFGVLTMSIQYIFGVLFPLVLGFYIYISLLEDCGYLPRVAVLTDGLLGKLGLNGRAVIPIILGFGCVTMATVSTRVLTSQRERTIASALLAITIPCSAQLAVISALMAKAGGLVGWGVYLLILVIMMSGLGSVLNRVLPGRSTSLVMDLPPMRMPSLGNIAKKSWIRTKVFLIEAAPLFMLGSLIVAVLQTTGLLLAIQNWLSPVTTALLHLPGEAAQVFIMGMVRRDFGAAGLLMMGDTLSHIQVLTALVVITLFVPCLASATVIWKERGPLESTVTIVGSWVLAFGTGAFLARLFEAFPIF
ncbi:MAG: ferrous iron transport protein B [Vampirovibrionales bacterium]|nr:ferrous iron transport protein B [Vampirovibrionales bacterium]